MLGISTHLTEVSDAWYSCPMTGRAENETWDCATDPVVRISQDKGTFGFLGECKRITVSGKKNVLRVGVQGGRLADRQPRHGRGGGLNRGEWPGQSDHVDQGQEVNTHLRT
jgi:hypothetical protein